jgi:hypothetical protein
MTRFGCVRSSACGENLRALELRPDPDILTPTFEKMGPVGEGLAMEARAVCLVGAPSK